MQLDLRKCEYCVASPNLQLIEAIGALESDDVKGEHVGYGGHGEGTPMATASQNGCQVSHGWLQVGTSHPEEFRRGEQAHGALHSALFYG